LIKLAPGSNGNMNYYQSQVQHIRITCYPKQDVVDRLVRAKQWMDRECEQSLVLDRVAGISCISKFHFIRLFRQCYGCTPHQYLTETRIRKAKLLLGSNLTVSDTCFRLGFESPASFASLFRKHTGVSPSVFRQKSNFR